jgi:UPF0716 protein FxsA
VFRILLFLFIVIPIAEFSLLYYMSDRFGLLPTVGLVLVTGIAGASLAKSQGLKTWQHIQSELQQGQMPSSALLDALMIFLAGALLVTPGVLTDLFGFSLLIPPCRALYKRIAQRYFQVKFSIGSMPPGSQQGRSGPTQIIDSYVVDEESESTPKVESEKEA